MKYLLAPLLVLSPLTVDAASNWNSTDFTRVEKNSRPSRIIVDNRVLANINDHPISVIDLMKKMDTYFYKDYPHLVDSDVARYQFYKGHWNFVFNDMINNQLIFCDAQNRKVDVSRGDIRQEMDRLYGPEIITNLDKIGLTFDEAWEMTKKDIYVRRMMSSVLFLKGAYDTSPEDLLSAFEDYAEKNKKPDHWIYHILSFRGPNALENAQMAKGILDEMNQNTKDFSALSLLLKEKLDQFDSKEITISDQFKLKNTEISEKHQSVLEDTNPQSFSDPFEEMSRIDKKSVYRIFYLAEYIPGGKIEFSEVEDQLKESLIQSRVDEEISTYITSLRDRFGVSQQSLDEVLPSQFEPFMIR